MPKLSKDNKNSVTSVDIQNILGDSLQQVVRLHRSADAMLKPYRNQINQITEAAKSFQSALIKSGALSSMFEMQKRLKQLSRPILENITIQQVPYEQRKAISRETTIDLDLLADKV